MAFKIRTTQDACPDDPEALLRDLRKKTIPGLLSHQADIIRSYVRDHQDDPDVALQLPTGSGKTLVGLLIGEWRRRKNHERIVYLCPTKQLVHQVASHASSKYGLDVHAFVGSRADYDTKAKADWQSSEALGITTYSALFNTNPFFVDPQVIILDDAHSAENYIASFWSLLVDRSEDEPAYIALCNLILPLLPVADRSRLASEPEESEERDWVEKLPTPVLNRLVPELVSLLDEYTKTTNLRYPWHLLRDSLHACHLYLSRRAILIRPLIPPSNTHAPFAQASQRIYMSATLGAGGDLERVTGRSPIPRIPVPSGWDKQGIGRRFFVLPSRSLDETGTDQLVANAIELKGRALYLVPDSWSANDVRKNLTSKLRIPVFTAAQIEESKEPFVRSDRAVAVIANRYDGIDLTDDDCRLLFVDGLPQGANLQERFFVLRVAAQLLLDDRILTRVVQGFGRCTRSPNDYAAVVVLGESLNRYLFAPERRRFFHPEMQAELEFGLEQSKNASVADMVGNLRHFFAQDSDWDAADREIVALRAGLQQTSLPATAELAAAAPSEIAYANAIWEGDFNRALENCRSVLGKLNDTGLRGYRALWSYLAGSVAWLSWRAGSLKDDEIARGYFRQAQAAAPVVRWLVGLSSAGRAPGEAAQESQDGIFALVERLEMVLEGLGNTHDRKYDAEEAKILRSLMQNDDGKHFEYGHERLGRLLGFAAGNSDEEGAPDPWWFVDDSLCFVFEDHAEAKSGTRLSVTKARQAASHPNWIRSRLNLSESAEIIPVLITPCSVTTKGALPHLNQVRYWHLDSFREWVKQALRAVRDIRRDFPGPGDLDWRSRAAQKLRAAAVGPAQLKLMLARSGAESMTVEDGAEDDE